MPRFTYVGDEGRHYPTLGITPAPGDTHDLDEQPADGRWEAVEPTEEADSTDEADTATQEG